MSSRCNLDLVLMGKTGNGKSSTGNSILGRKEFVAMGGGKSVTKTYQVGYRRFEDRDIKVVDIPGVFDTDTKDREEQKKLILTPLKEGLSLFPDGFSALLLIVPYSNRFTDEEVNAIEALKMILGDDILSKHTVCVFTRGDDFEADCGDEDFQQWIRTQGGPVKRLMTDIDYRVVLFNNREMDKAKNDAQIDQLFGKIVNLERYTWDALFKTEKLRKEDKQAAMALEEYSKNVALIVVELEEIMLSDSPDQKEKLAKAKKSIDQVFDNISKEKYRHVSKIKKQLTELKKNIAMYEDMYINQEQNVQEASRLEENALHDPAQKEENALHDPAQKEENALHDPAQKEENALHDPAQKEENALQDPARRKK